MRKLTVIKQMLLAGLSMLSLFGCLYQHQSSMVSMRLDVQPDAWEEVTLLMNNFSQQHELSFKNFSENYPSGNRKILLRMNSRQKAEVDVVGMFYPAETGVSSGINEWLAVSVYENASGSDWEVLAQALLELLEQTWPGKVTILEKD